MASPVITYPVTVITSQGSHIVMVPWYSAFPRTKTDPFFVLGTPIGNSPAGYDVNASHVSPVAIGIQETDTDNDTLGDLILATRPTTEGTKPPTVRMRITSDGQILKEGNAAPKSDNELVTKSYVDEHLGDPSTFVFTYEVSELPWGINDIDPKSIHVVPFDLKVRDGPIAKKSWATAYGARQGAAFDVVRVRDKALIYGMYAYDTAGVYTPVSVGNVDLKAGEEIGITRTYGPTSKLMNYVINLYFTKD